LYEIIEQSFVIEERAIRTHVEMIKSME